MKKTMIAIAALALAVVFVLAGCAAKAPEPAPASAAVAEPAAPQALEPVRPSESEPAGEITVSASASVSLVPDKATVSFAVTTQEETADKAQQENSRAVERVVAVLTGRGIDEKSIRTSYYNLYPQYSWSDMDGQKIIGYSVTTSMTVQDQAIDELGKLLSALVDAGVNEINNVSFLCSGYDEAYEEAIIQAVAAARSKAEAVAAAEGKTLGDAVSIMEGWQDTSARYANGYDSKMSITVEEAAMDMAAPVLQPGETEISANVTVTYRMK